jgi:hypothetical protein
MTRNRLLYRPQLVVDGNMKLVRLGMKRPEADVALSDGELFAVRRAPYMKHLAVAPERQPVSSPKTLVRQRADRIQRNRDVIITGPRTMVISIGNIWIVQVKVPVHAQDMVPSSHTVWLIFKKENGSYIRHHDSNYITDCAIVR